jgi:hypothetical protein
VRVGEVRDIFFAHGFGVLSEVWMIDSIDGVDSSAPVEAHEIFQE